MMSVEIDDAALAAEAAAVAGAAPAAANDSTMPDQPTPDSWAPIIDGLAPTLAVIVFPQWKLAPAEVANFAAALADCLDQLFPGGLAGKYACYARLAAVSAGIVATRYVQHGALPPLGPVREEPKEKPDASGTASAAA